MSLLCFKIETKPTTALPYISQVLLFPLLQSRISQKISLIWQLHFFTFYSFSARCYLDSASAISSVYLLHVAKAYGCFSVVLHMPFKQPLSVVYTFLLRALSPRGFSSTPVSSYLLFFFLISFSSKCWNLLRLSLKPSIPLILYSLSKWSNSCPQDY